MERNVDLGPIQTSSTPFNPFHVHLSKSDRVSPSILALLAEKGLWHSQINASRLAHLLTSEPRQVSICKRVDFTVIDYDYALNGLMGY